MLVAIVLVVALKADERHGDDRGVPYASAVATASLNAKGVVNDQRGYLLTGDPTFIHEADGRISTARAAFGAAIDAAADPAQRRAVDDARSGFERWVQTMRGEVATFQAGIATAPSRPRSDPTGRYERPTSAPSPTPRRSAHTRPNRPPARPLPRRHDGHGSWSPASWPRS
jgi:methyl-accepting chemotaxis protein